ncbi:MAG: MarC family protein [Burkholderiales bacterium]|jgi:multiple antibiotic resistance protein
MELYKPLITLLAMVNPIGVIPFFIAFTQEFDRAQRQQTIRVAAFTSFCVIALSAVLGLKLIEFFGISIASFQVGGGTLLLISALQMLNAKQAEAGSVQASGAGANIAVVPLAVPLLTGPATISTMVIYAQKYSVWWYPAVLVGYGVVIGLVIYLCFTASGKIAKVLGSTGINIMTRLMGLILAALAVELLQSGLIELFPILGAKGVR